MPDLRARRHRATRSEIIEVGLRLFESRGYDAVTMEEIADAAGVSRRTLYRHFPSKDRILLDLTAEATASWDGVLAELAADTPARVVLERAARAGASHLDAQREQLRTAWRIIATTPAIETAFLANAAWTERLVAVLTDEARGHPFEPAAAAVVAGAYLGALDAAMAHWASGSDGTIADGVDMVITQLAPIWSRRRGAP